MKIRRNEPFFLVKKEDTIYNNNKTLGLWENNKRRKGLRLFLTIMRNTISNIITSLVCMIANLSMKNIISCEIIDIITSSFA
jgi:uncharacterized protein with ParB-like and HNH nuclease domain